MVDIDTYLRFRDIGLLGASAAPDGDVAGGSRSPLRYAAFFLSEGGGPRKDQFL